MLPVAVRFIVNQMITEHGCNLQQAIAVARAKFSLEYDEVVRMLKKKKKQGGVIKFLPYLFCCVYNIFF